MKTSHFYYSLISLYSLYNFFSFITIQKANDDVGQIMLLDVGGNTKASQAFLAQL